MSVSLTHPPDQTTAPPGRRFATQFAALLAALVMLFGGLFFAPAPAQAASLGVGYGNQDLWIGSFESHGRHAYCMDLDALPPWGSTQHPELQTTLDSLSSQQLAELNYVMAKWGANPSPNEASAVQLYVWAVADAGNYAARGGDGFYVTRAPESERAAILSLLATMRAEAPQNAVPNPSVSMQIEMSDQYAGQLTISTRPGALKGEVTLTNGTFANGGRSATLGAGTHQIVGVPPTGAPEYRVGAEFRASAAGLGAGVDLFYTPGEQRILGVGSFGPVSASEQSPVIPMDFQPELTTEVSTKYVQVGDPFVDGVHVSVSKHSWIHVDGKPIPVTAEGRLYGPFDAQPAEANAPPEGAPLAGTEQLTLTGAGSYESPGTITAAESGFYTWVWSIDKDAQGENAKYLTNSFTDRFGLVAETSVAPFQPGAVSKADQRLAKPGDKITDTIEVDSTNGAWLKHDGTPIPVVFEGTAYQVPGALPPEQGATVPESAEPIETVTVTATGPGTYQSPEVTAPKAGFVTWVWEMKIASQPDWVQPYLAADWTDDYGINVETTSVRWPVTIESEMREFNVHKGGRAFDRITMSGFPDDHGDFTGDGYWEADIDEVTHTVYGPFTSEKEMADDLDLEDAPVLTTTTTPARNGTYEIGYSDDDQIKPTKSGYYVMVSSFMGDDRVQPHITSPADIRERFFVPEDEQPLSVVTQATSAALVGEEFEDRALVQGTEIPEDAYLVFRAYGPHNPGAEAVCETPFFTSEKIPVTQAGVYASGMTSVDRPGHVYWIETLYDADGEVLAEGRCGAPGETTVVTETREEQPVPERPEIPKQQLANTGSDDSMWPMLAAGAALATLAAGVTLIAGRRHVQRKAAEETDDAEPGEDGDAFDQLMKQ